MFIHILGSCSGTEPMPGRDYTSWILEKDNGKLLLFDAGGECYRTAWLKGLSMLKIESIFISHPHSDHTDGLPGFFACIRKEKWLRNVSTPWPVPCYISKPSIIESSYDFIRGGHSDEWDITPEIHEIKTPGTLYQDKDGVVIETLPNLHMAPDADGHYLSWSFRIRAAGKTILYTGDVKHIDELKPWWFEHADLLMLETGHHRAEFLCQHLREENANVDELLFVHHGIEILRDTVGEKILADNAWKRPVLFASDGMTLKL